MRTQEEEEEEEEEGFVAWVEGGGEETTHMPGRTHITQLHTGTAPSYLAPHAAYPNHKHNQMTLQVGLNCTHSRRARPRVFEDEEGPIPILLLLLLHQCTPIDALRMEERAASSLGGIGVGGPAFWELVAALLLWFSSCRFC